MKFSQYPYFLLQIVDLQGPVLSKIQTVFKALNVTKIFRWIILGSGMLLMGFGGYLYFHNRKMFQVTYINDPKTKSSKSTSEKFDAENLSIQSVPKSENIKRSFNNSVMTGREFDRYNIQ